MEIVITCDSGVNPSHLVDKLLKMGNNVKVIKSLSKEEYNVLNNKVECFDINLCNENLIDAFKNIEPRAVYHESEKIDMQRFINKESFRNEKDFLGLVNVLNCCVVCGVTKFLYRSSLDDNEDYSELFIDIKVIEAIEFYQNTHERILSERLSVKEVKVVKIIN